MQIDLLFAVERVDVLGKLLHRREVTVIGGKTPDARQVPEKAGFSRRQGDGLFEGLARFRRASQGHKRAAETGMDSRIGRINSERAPKMFDGLLRAAEPVHGVAKAGVGFGV